MRHKKMLFAISLLIQLALLLVISLPRLEIIAKGKTVLLETQPYDPYNIFRGYYATLFYEISETDNLPGFVKPKNHQLLYVVLSEGEDKVWRPVRVSPELPRDLGTNEVFIRGKYSYGRLEYGIEEYYLPEKSRHKVESMLGSEGSRPLVEVKVNKAGKATIIRLIIGETSFEY